jgi:hypothetical protein
MNPRLGNSRTPTLSEVIRTATNAQLRDFYVALPGCIVKYNPAKLEVDVKPLLQRAYVDEDGNDDVDDLPIITSVPVIVPKAGGQYLFLPPTVGDNVLLLFCDRSLDLYMSSSGSIPVDPVDFREHDLSDAVALLGFFPTTRTIKDVLGTDAVFGKEKGTQIRSKGSTIEVTTAGGVTANDFVAMAAKVYTELSKIAAILSSHVHTGGILEEGLTGPPVPPSYSPSPVPSINLKAD